MIRVRDILLALLLAAAPLAGASAEQRDGRSPLLAGSPFASALTGQFDGQARQEKAREEARDGQRMELGEIVRRVQSGRDGRMLGVRPQGSDYVVRWEYPGGRIVDLTVDGRTGRVIGER